MIHNQRTLTLVFDIIPHHPRLHQLPYAPPGHLRGASRTARVGGGVGGGAGQGGEGKEGALFFGVEGGKKLGN